MIIFDQRVGEERKQFATQTSKINKKMKVVLDDGFVGNETTEFYEGLLAGYARTHQLLLSKLTKQEMKEFIGFVVAYLSEILEERT